MTAPEVRLSPDGRDVAIRNLKQVAPVASGEWRSSDGAWLTDAQVADWTPLLPVSSKDGA